MWREPCPWIKGLWIKGLWIKGLWIKGFVKAPAL